VLGIWLGNLAAGEWWQGRALERWERLAGHFGAARPVVPPPPWLMRPVGGIDFRLRVPRLHYTAVVREGVTPQVLFTGPGHYPGTAWPGQDGNVGIAAHNVYWLRFDQLRPGDLIYLDTRYGTFRYRVTESLVVPPDATWVLEDAPGRRLTLTTCSPLWAGQFAAGRLVIFATSDQATDPGGRVSRLPGPVPPAGDRAHPAGHPGPRVPAAEARPPAEAAPGGSSAAPVPELVVPPAGGHGDREHERPRSRGAPPALRPAPGHERGRTPPERFHHPPSPPPEREGRGQGEGRRAGVRDGSPSPAASRGASRGRR